MNQRVLDFERAVRNEDVRRSWISQLPASARIRKLVAFLDQWGREHNLIVGPDVMAEPSRAEVLAGLGLKPTSRDSWRALKAEVAACPFVSLDEHPHRPHVWVVHWQAIADCPPPAESKEGEQQGEQGGAEITLRGSKAGGDSPPAAPPRGGEQQPRAMYMSFKDLDLKDMSSDIPRARVPGVSGRSRWPGNISKADLANPQRLEALWQVATANGWIDRGEATRLAFFTLAAAVLSKHPPAEVPGAMFTAGVRHRRWFGSGKDEDWARAAIKSLDADPTIVREERLRPADDFEQRRDEAKRKLAEKFGEAKRP